MHAALNTFAGTDATIVTIAVVVIAFVAVIRLFFGPRNGPTV